jgi:hypothetical protein
MHFLEYLDKQYIDYKKVNGIPEMNRQYRYYEEVIPQNTDDDNQKFEILKIGDKTKILICFKSLKVYLSDLDIINTILKLPEDEINWFIDEFYYICNKQYTLFEFEISKKKFRGIGLPYKESTNKIRIQCDNEVSINSFIFIINIILTKDLLGTLKLRRSNNEIKKARDLLKATLYKYISLIKYYRFKDENFANYLKDIEYPIDEGLDDVFCSYEKTKKINRLFESYNIFEEKILM